MAEMKTPAQGQNAQNAEAAPAAGGKKTGAQGGSGGEQVEKDTDYTRKAEEFIKTTEQRLDELISTAEKVLAKGTQYTGIARSWMNEHPEYRARAEKIVSKATEFRDRVSTKLSERSNAMRAGAGESTAEHLRAQGKETLERGLEKGKEVLEKGRERLRSGKSGAVMSARSGTNRVSAFVRNNPTDTLLLGTAIGVIVGTAVKHSRELAPDADYTGSTYGL